MVLVRTAPAVVSLLRGRNFGLTLRFLSALQRSSALRLQPVSMSMRVEAPTPPLVLQIVVVPIDGILFPGFQAESGGA